MRDPEVSSRDVVTRGNRRAARRAMAVVIFVGAALILLLAFQWYLVDWVTPFIFVPLLMLAWACFALGAVWAAAHLIRRRAEWRTACLPLTVAALFFLIAVFVPFTRLTIEYEYWIHRAAREAILNQIAAGSLRPASDSLLTLPSSAPLVSRGGNQVIVEMHDGSPYVLFFTFRGMLDSYAGFLHVPHGGDPKKFEDLNETDRSEIEHRDGDWFFVSHH
jgi:hypothetical protein